MAGKMSKKCGKHKIVKVLFIALFLMTVFSIFLNSTESQTDSYHKSQAVTEKLELMSGKQIGSEYELNMIVRKMAHFLEFAVLGIVLSAISRYKCLNCGVGAYRFVTAAFCGLLIALIDETIQIFTKRGSLVSDIWIDFGAVIAGILLIDSIIWIYKKIEGKKND